MRQDLSRQVMSRLAALCWLLSTRRLVESCYQDCAHRSTPRPHPPNCRNSPALDLRGTPQPNVAWVHVAGSWAQTWTYSRAFFEPPMCTVTATSASRPSETGVDESTVASPASGSGVKSRGRQQGIAWRSHAHRASAFTSLGTARWLRGGPRDGGCGRRFVLSALTPGTKKCSSSSRRH